jgi:predicted N-formylglutamate amidohydrolase
MDMEMELVSGATLLGGEDPPVFEVEGLGARSPFVFTCDHGGRHIPRRLANLGLDERALTTHVASDLGVAELGRRLAVRMDAFLIVQNYSRLVVDVNRPPEAADSITTLSECTRVAANEGLAFTEVRQRLQELFRPYHERISEELDDRAIRGLRSVLVALHSFTPVYMGRSRPWHVGVLYGRYTGLARRILVALRSDEALVVGDNQPYAVSDETDYTIIVHGEQRGIPHVEIEVRQDLLASETGLDDWTERLAGVLEPAVKNLLPP